MQRMLELLREDAMCPNLIVSSHEALGQGSRLTLQKVGNIDVAFNTQAASKTVSAHKSCGTPPIEERR